MSNIKTPLITVIMPLYNKAAEVGRAVESVLAQTVNDFELIIVNDGSTDNGPDLVRGIQNPRVRIIDQKNEGVSAARNRGIMEARAELIAFLDADDEWESDFLATIIRLRCNFPFCDAFATAYYYSTPDGQRRPVFFRGMPKSPWEGVADFCFPCDLDPPISMSAIAVTKKAITSIGGFPVGITIGEDLLMRVRLRLEYDIAYSTHLCSIYWAPVSVRPERKPQYPDFVGDELERLGQMLEPSKADELREIAASWHRRRGIMHISLGEKEKALQEIHKAKAILGVNGDLNLLAAIARMPKGFSTISLSFLKRAKAMKRKLVSMTSQSCISC